MVGWVFFVGFFLVLTMSEKVVGASVLYLLLTEVSKFKLLLEQSHYLIISYYPIPGNFFGHNLSIINLCI